MSSDQIAKMEQDRTSKTQEKDQEIVSVGVGKQLDVGNPHNTGEDKDSWNGNAFTVTMMIEGSGTIVKGEPAESNEKRLTDAPSQPFHKDFVIEKLVLDALDV